VQFRIISVEVCCIGHSSFRHLTLFSEKNKEQSLLHTHAFKVLPELNFCEQHLSCVIEGVERDHLLVRFARLRASDQNCEASFVIDVSSKTYRSKLVICSLLFPVF